jgi:hypothetical protein
MLGANPLCWFCRDVAHFYERMIILLQALLNSRAVKSSYTIKNSAILKLIGYIRIGLHLIVA